MEELSQGLGVDLGPKSRSCINVVLRKAALCLVAATRRAGCGCAEGPRQWLRQRLRQRAGQRWAPFTGPAVHWHRVPPGCRSVMGLPDFTQGCLGGGDLLGCCSRLKCCFCCLGCGQRAAEKGVSRYGKGSGKRAHFLPFYGLLYQLWFYYFKLLIYQWRMFSFAFFSSLLKRLERWILNIWFHADTTGVNGYSHWHL